jgi:hypothetical protein
MAESYRHPEAGVNAFLRESDRGLYCFLRLTAEGELDLTGARIIRQHQFDGAGRFDTALLLKFINPIGNCFDHFTRSLRGRVSLRRGLLLTRPLVLLYDFDNFLF